MDEFLQYGDLDKFISKGSFLISVRPDKGVIAVIIEDELNKKVLAKIKMPPSAFSKVCSDFVFALAKYMDLERKHDSSSPPSSDILE